MFHTTANYGRVIPAPARSNDPDIGIPALSVMVVPKVSGSRRKGAFGRKSEQLQAKSTEPCCKHHPRIVSIPQALFVDWAGEESESEWSLFFVCEHAVNDPPQKAFKYILFCTSDPNSPLQMCKGWKKYKEAFSGAKPRDLFHHLGQMWDQWSFNKNSHFHIGILGTTAFSQYTDMNEAEWMHLRPDVPSVHRQLKDLETPSEPESLSESEIFKRFAFENDEQEGADGAWTLVKPKNKALDGCLPFCFEGNRNIFPDCDGVFRHYCRAEALWQCRRKTCTRKAAPLGKKEQDDSVKDDATRTSWKSACSWYHEHLKDNETQGVRKGFERQYCRECWQKSREWVEGKMCKFFKPGTFGDEPKRAHHSQEMCEICRRLNEKGFDQPCFQFNKYLAAGKVKVTPGSTGWSWAETP